MIRPVALAFAVAAVPWGLVSGQGDCFPASDSHEARSFGILSVPLAFTDAGGSSTVGRWHVGVEAAAIPRVPSDLATPTTCRPGKGPENTNPIAGLVRLRAGLNLGAWQLSVGWVPPVALEHVRANLVGVGLGRTVDLGVAWQLMPRVHALLGALHAPVTCSDAAIADPSSECFGGTRSNDRWRPGVFGAEVVASRVGGRLEPHVGIGYSWLRPRFRVDFTNALGETDRRRVTVDLHRMALFAGMSYRMGRWSISAGGYGTVHDRVSGRLVIRRDG